MNLLLDTHVWIWSQEAPDRLGERTRKLLINPAAALNVSTISTLEIARLIDGGLLDLSGTIETWVRRSLEYIQARSIDLSHEIAIAAYALPAGFHKDPADRVLAATARVLDLEFVTADERILAYRHIRTIDARL